MNSDYAEFIVYSMWFSYIVEIIHHSASWHSSENSPGNRVEELIPQKGLIQILIWIWELTFIADQSYMWQFSFWGEHGFYGRQPVIAVLKAGIIGDVVHQ